MRGGISEEKKRRRQGRSAMRNEKMYVQLQTDGRTGRQTNRQRDRLICTTEHRHNRYGFSRKYVLRIKEKTPIAIGRQKLKIHTQTHKKIQRYSKVHACEY